MDIKQIFIQHLTDKGKEQDYIDMSKELLDSFYKMLGSEPPSSEVINTFVRNRWSGYLSRDKATYQILNEYADFCEIELPVFTDAFRKHICETFEGEARKAAKGYKNALAYIPQSTKIAPCFLDGLANDEFVEAFRALQELIYGVYDAIEHGSPFNWGWSDWKSIEVEGINQNRVMKILDALVNSGHIDGDMLVVDKKTFGGYAVCKPVGKAKLMLEGFMRMGLQIEEFDNKKSTTFTASYPDTPNLIRVLCSYFKNRLNDSHNHVNVLSYRFVEDSAEHTRECLFLAKTDGEPEHLREIYYWLYDEAVKHGFSPTGYEHMGCYSYKKGSKEWLLLGSGTSYHEDDFLHSPTYMLAAKARFHRVFQTHPDKIDELLKRFPASVGRPWDWCFCNIKPADCKNRIILKKNGQEHIHCGTKTYFYFHDPDFDGVKAILELYKLENKL